MLQTRPPERGDEAFSTSQWARTQLLAGPARPQPRDVLRVSFALAPRLVRASILRRRIPSDVFPWLRDHARRSVEHAAAREAAGEPLRWVRGSPGCDACVTWRSARPAWMLRRRRGRGRSSSALDRRFWAALSALPRSTGFTAVPRRCGSSSAICCRSRSSLGPRKRPSTTPSGTDTAASSPRRGRERASMPRSSTRRHSGVNGCLRPPIHARIYSPRPRCSKALGQPEPPMSWSRTSVEASCPCQSGGRRSSQGKGGEIEQAGWVAWGEPQTPLSAESRDSRLGRNARRLDTIAPGEEDRSAQWRRFGNLCEAQAPPLPGAHDASGRPTPKCRAAEGRRSIDLGAANGMSPSRISMSSERTAIPRNAREARSVLFPAPRSPTTPRRPHRARTRRRESFPDRTSAPRRPPQGRGKDGSTPGPERTLHPEDDAAALSVEAYLAAVGGAIPRRSHRRRRAHTRVAGGLGTNMERRPARIRGDQSGREPSTPTSRSPYAPIGARDDDAAGSLIDRRILVSWPVAEVGTSIYISPHDYRFPWSTDPARVRRSRDEYEPRGSSRSVGIYELTLHGCSMDKKWAAPTA